jgi:hypothetical protein
VLPKRHDSERAKAKTSHEIVLPAKGKGSEQGAIDSEQFLLAIPEVILLNQEKTMSVFDSSMNSLLSDEESRSPREDSLPSLKLSLSSLEQSLHNIDVNATDKMWKAIGNTDRPLRPDDMLPSRLDSRKRVSNPIKHKVRAHTRPDDWLGPSSKPSGRSWAVKKIMESSDLLEDDT